MGNVKPKKDKHKVSMERWIALLGGIMAVLGWSLLIYNALPKPPPPQPPTIQSLQLSQDSIPAGETIDARVIVHDPNLPDDDINYFWQAYFGKIGEQLNRFQDHEATYVAPDQPGIDFLTVVVRDRTGGTDRDFRAITITERRKRQVIIGNKNFTEQHIVGELMKQLLEDRGFAVVLKSDLYSSVLRREMEDGEIDICADYTGTVWTVHLKHKCDPGMDNNELYRLVKEEEGGKGHIWLKPIWNNNTYALASWPDFVAEYGLKDLSGLGVLYQEKEGKIKTFVDPDFVMRPDGLPGLEKHYDFKIDESYIIIGKPGESLKALAEREVDVAMVFGTDAPIAEYGWHVYIDDKNFFSPYDLTPYVRKVVLDQYPEIVDILNELVATFPGGGGPATPEIVADCQKFWQELNAKVDIKGMKPGEVAHEYLVGHDLIKE